MGRMTLAEKQKYIDLDKNGILDDGRMILQEGTKIECLDCGHEEILDKFVITKYYQCQSCGKSKEVTFDGDSKSDLPLLELEESEEEEKEVKKKKKGDTKASRIFKVKASLFDLDESERV